MTETTPEVPRKPTSEQTQVAAVLMPEELETLLAASQGLLRAILLAEALAGAGTNPA